MFDNDREEYLMQEHVHRYICSCFEEMRKVVETQTRYNLKRSQDVLLSLIEEAQVHANRMETGLSYGEDIHKLHKIRKDLVNEIRHKRQKED